MKEKIIGILLILVLIINIMVPVIYASIDELENNNPSNLNNVNENKEVGNKEDKKPEEDKESEEEIEIEKEEEVKDDIKENNIEEDKLTDENDKNLLKTSLASQNQVIKDGTYIIKTAINENRVIDIDGGSINNFANVQIYDNANVKQQKFNITYQSDGYYKIEAVHSKKVFDVSGGVFAKGSNVQQYESNNTDSQKWTIKDEGEGYYSIISKYNDLYLDVSGGKNINGANIQIYEKNDSISQKFKFEKIDEIVAEKTIENGIYNIKTKIDENKVLDVNEGSNRDGANIQIYQNTNVKQQKFNITYLQNGYYKIEALHSGKVLDVEGGSSNPGANVWQYTSNNSNAQQWIIKQEDDGYYSIISKCNNLFLDISGGVNANGTNVQVYTSNNSSSQRFKLEEVEGNQIKAEKTIETGMYKIRTALDKNKVIDIDGGSKQNNANVQIYQDTDVKQQKFHITYLGDGYYTIKAVHSKKSLDVQDGKTTNGTNIQQYVSQNIDGQKWIIKDNGNGRYSIISKCNDLFIDVQNGMTKNGTNIQLYEMNNSLSQEFIFEPTEAQAIDNGVYKIRSAINPNKVLDISGGSRSDGANVQLYQDNESNAQKYQVDYIGDGYYTIKVVHSKKALDVEDYGKTNGTNIQQYVAQNNSAQQWLIKDLENGYYNIISKCNGLYMDVAGGVAKNGSNIHMYEANNSNAQKFIFEETQITQFYGIDVSEHNGMINWFEVASSGKVDFAIIRAAYRGYGTGRIVTDNTFSRNILGASANGIDIGLYFFTQAINEEEAIQEADYIMNLIKTYNIKTKYPIAIDTEYSSSTTNGVNDNKGRADNLSVEERTAVCKAFCDRIIQYGYTPMIYASVNWFYNNLDESKLTSYEKWVAHYTNGGLQTPTNYKNPYSIWQYTSTGSLPGIYSKGLDLNICYKKYN